MLRLVSAVVTCACIVSLVGCSVVKNETKTDNDKKEHKVSVLGIGLWHTEKPVGKSGE